MDEEIIDLPPEERTYQEAIQWWEKKRLLFNVLVGLSGLACIVMHLKAFQVIDIFHVILWGGLANILFSTGTLIEIWDQYYLRNKFKLDRFRSALFWIGTLLYCIVSFVFGSLYFTMLF